MLKPGDLILHQPSNKIYEIVTSEVVYDNKTVAGHKKTDKDRTQYKHWVYRVQPYYTTEWRWLYKHNKIFKNKEWVCYDETGERLYMGRGVIFPGQFESSGFRLINKRQQAVVKVLYGKS